MEPGRIEESLRGRLQRARRSPVEVFGDPATVVRDPALSRAEKLDVLRRWAYDALELEIAADEGMAGGEPSQLAQILQALDRIISEAD